MKPIRKVFIQMMLGEPLPWLKQYVENVNRLKDYGWEWMIFTDKPIKTKGNFKVVPFTLGDFDERVRVVTGIDPENYIDPERHWPHKLLSDYYPAYGALFREYLDGASFWGHTNWDVVYGRLDHFFDDNDMLMNWDIVTDTVEQNINGPFTLYRNTQKVNDLWREIPNWQEYFRSHELFYVDETHFGNILPKLVGERGVRLWKPRYYPMHSYDRFCTHIPETQLSQKEDGTLWEVFRDGRDGTFPHGREIPFFHFSSKKEWPKCLSA